METPVLAAVVQAYTSQSLSESANKVYGPQEILAAWPPAPSPAPRARARKSARMADLSSVPMLP